MESAECGVAEYGVKTVKRRTAATEATESEVTATEAAERDAVRSEVKAAEST